MTPDKHIADIPIHTTNLPWYLLVTTAVVAKIEMVPMKLLVAILITIISGFGGFIAYRGSSWADRIEVRIDKIYNMMARKSEIDHYQMTCINELRIKQGLEPLIIPRFGGDDFGDR